MPRRDKTVYGVTGVILAIGGFIAAIAYSSMNQMQYVILSGIIVVAGVILTAYAFSD